VIVISIGAVATVFGLVKVLSGKTPSRYSEKWFEVLPDDELASEREKVRKAFCTAGKDLVQAIRLENLLGMFDKEMSRRAWSGHSEYEFPVHREHGWYLSGKD
jgi:hypothetical protein